MKMNISSTNTNINRSEKLGILGIGKEQDVQNEAKSG
jgi:hypothetical protein